MQKACSYLIPLLRYGSHSHGMANSEVETQVCDGVHTTKIQTTHDGKIAIWFTSRFASFFPLYDSSPLQGDGPQYDSISTTSYSHSNAPLYLILRHLCNTAQKYSTTRTLSRIVSGFLACTFLIELLSSLIIDERLCLSDFLQHVTFMTATSNFGKEYPFN